MPVSDAATIIERPMLMRAGLNVANSPDVWRTILVAYDGSSLAEPALTCALQVARGSGARLLLLRASVRIDKEVLSGAESLVAAASHELAELARAADELSARAERLRSDRVVAAARIGVGEPSEVILDAARLCNANLIVMGTRRRSWLARWWQGSIR